MPGREISPEEIERVSEFTDAEKRAFLNFDEPFTATPGRTEYFRIAQYLEAFLDCADPADPNHELFITRVKELLQSPYSDINEETIRNLGNVSANFNTELREEIFEAALTMYTYAELREKEYKAKAIAKFLDDWAEEGVELSEDEQYQLFQYAKELLSDSSDPSFVKAPYIAKNGFKHVAAFIDISPEFFDHYLNLYAVIAGARQANGSQLTQELEANAREYALEYFTKAAGEFAELIAQDDTVTPAMRKLRIQILTDTLRHVAAYTPLHPHSKNYVGAKLARAFPVIEGQLPEASAQWNEIREMLENSPDQAVRALLTQSTELYNQGHTHTRSIAREIYPGRN